ncbi:MAG: hypothetical protein ACLRQF_04355 [Thomasclavelia ramosa]
MIRDKNGNPDLFAGTIRNLDKNREQASRAKFFRYLFRYFVLYFMRKIKAIK